MTIFQSNQSNEQRNNQNNNNLQNPSNNSIHLAQYKKEMIINFDPQIMQTSLTNWLNNYVNNTNFQLNNFKAQNFANVGSQINELSKKISEAFVNVQI